MRERHKATAAQLHGDMSMCQGAGEHVSGLAESSRMRGTLGSPAETHLRAPAW